MLRVRHLKINNSHWSYSTRPNKYTCGSLSWQRSERGSLSEAHSCPKTLVLFAIVSSGNIQRLFNLDTNVHQLQLPPLGGILRLSSYQQNSSYIHTHIHTHKEYKLVATHKSRDKIWSVETTARAIARRDCAVLAPNHARKGYYSVDIACSARIGVRDEVEDGFILCPRLQPYGKNTEGACLTKDLERYGRLGDDRYRGPGRISYFSKRREAGYAL